MDTPPATDEELARARARREAHRRHRFAAELVLRGRSVADAFQAADAFFLESERRMPPPASTDPARAREINRQLDDQLDRERFDF